MSLKIRNITAQGSVELPSTEATVEEEVDIVEEEEDVEEEEEVEEDSFAELTAISSREYAATLARAWRKPEVVDFLEVDAEAAMKSSKMSSVERMSRPSATGSSSKSSSTAAAWLFNVRRQLVNTDSKIFLVERRKREPKTAIQCFS